MDREIYIVANKQQEYDILNKLEKTGVIWNDERKPTEYIPSYSVIIGFPYVIYSYEDGTLTYDGLSRINDKREIVFDGREGFDLIKEKNMGEKYVVSQEFMNELKKWKDTLDSNDNPNKPFVNWLDFENLPKAPSMWWGDDEAPDDENNNRLIAIIRWVNGEDVFEVKHKKWVVRSKEPQGSVDGKPIYGWFVDEYTVELEATMPSYVDRFNTKEEAESWANSHQEVVEVEG